MTTPQTDLDILACEEEPYGIPNRALAPVPWARRNLFNNWYNSIITVVLAAVSAYVLYRLVRFIFVTGRWEPVEVNLRLFMIGQFPWDERWRIVAQIIVTAAAIGFALGTMRATAVDKAEENDVEYEPESWKTYVSSYWALGLYVIVLLVGFTRTVGPAVMAVVALATLILARMFTAALPRRFRLWGWTLAALAAVIQFQLLSGTSGWSWFFGTLALAPLVADEVGRAMQRAPSSLPCVLAGAGAVVGVVALVFRTNAFGLIAVVIGGLGLVNVARGDRIDGSRVGAVMITGAVAYFVYDAIELEGIDWAQWGGFHLNIIATVVAIALAFPLGILLAFGRRSSLYAIRMMSVAYIEFFRGAPLITFLLSAQFFLGFFLDTTNPLSLITRAIAAITLFSAAYVAEIIRGGLQAVPSGQIEAGQAVGLSHVKIMRLIVLPQALRAVIPAMVGQFISLFKDTTLFVIITIPEYLAIREIVHSQEAFRGFGIGETLVFVAFGFWAVAFTMSRESQRLERRLGVGER